MKKRLVKKWVNRYLTPLVRDLPKIQGVVDRCEYESIEIVNGETVQPYEMYKINYSPVDAIKKQREKLINVLSSHNKGNIAVRKTPFPIIELNEVWYKIERRKHPRMKFYGVATELLVGKV